MKYADLLGWFDRPREEDVGIPTFVTRAEARNARRFLQEHSGFDFERFDESIQVEKLLNKPLGETSECLSAEEIDELVGSDRSSADLNTTLVARAIKHSQHCDTCFNNLALYQELKSKSAVRAIENDIKGLAPFLSIGSVGRVEAMASGEPCLALTLTMYCDALDFSGLDTIRARVLGPSNTFEKDVTLHRVEPWHKKLPGVDAALTSMRKSSARSFKGYYRTDPLAGLDQVQNNACGFVSIAQDIGGKGVLSRGVIRCVA